MSEVTQFVIEDEQGNDYVMYIEAAEKMDLSTEVEDDGEYDSMGPSNAIHVKLSEIHNKLRTYAYYATGAFRDLPFVDVEEMTMKFGIKVSGSTGIPFLTKGTAEADFHIELKCKPQKRQHSIDSPQKSNEDVSSDDVGAR